MRGASPSRSHDLSRLRAPSVMVPCGEAAGMWGEIAALHNPAGSSLMRTASPHGATPGAGRKVDRLWEREGPCPSHPTL